MAGRGESESGERASPLIGRLVATGFGVVSIIATATCALLLLALVRAGGHIDSMRGDEGLEAQSLALATAVREQYAAVARLLIDGGEGGLDAYEQAKGEVQESLDDLEPQLDGEDRGRLTEIRNATDDMDRLFVASLIPALEAADASEIRNQHGRLDELSRQAAQNADELARGVDSHMASKHVQATRVVRAGLVVAGGGVLLVLLSAFGFTVRLRDALLSPLAFLTAAAHRYAGGEFDHRVGDVGRGELRTVSLALDHMAEELGERETQLLRQERVAAIGALAAGVAHEINNPIGIIRGYLRTMGPEDDPEQLGNELKILDEEAAACQRICRDLLDFAAVPQLASRETEMSELVGTCATRNSEDHIADGKTIEAEAEAGTARVDAARVRQVLDNLVRNALAVTDDGGVVRLEGRADDDQYVVDIIDSGPGVPAGDEQRIFEPFVGRRSGGSGLGLAISRSIVEAHGGQLGLLQTGPDGSVFRAVFPRSGA